MKGMKVIARKHQMGVIQRKHLSILISIYRGTIYKLISSNQSDL